MRLSTVFELLLIFLLIAFAAYGRVIDRDEGRIFHRAIRAANESRQRDIGVEVMSLKQAAENVNKYCTCDGTICNCCRNFNIPIVQLKGPGCASLQYLEEDKLAVQLSVGDNILTSTVVNGQKPKAVCFPMPGGLTKFCGRIYSIQREADKHFKACLGLELQSSTELEAALRVSCFRFGPDGVKLRPAEQLPIVEADTPPVEEDDDDDFFGLGDDDDEDDEDDDEDAPEGNAVPDSSAISNDSEDDDDDDDDDDVLGFGALLDILTGDDDSEKKKKKPSPTTGNPLLPFTIPILTKPTVGLSIIENNGNLETLNIVEPIATTPVTISQPDTDDNSINNQVPNVDVTSNSDKLEESTSTEVANATGIEESPVTNAAVVSVVHTEATLSDVGMIAAANSLNQVHVAKPDKQSSLKKVSSPIKTMPTPTSPTINPIKIDNSKPSIINKPIKPNPAETHVGSNDNESNEDDEEVDDEELFESSDLDDEEDDDDDDDDEEDKDQDEDEDEKLDYTDVNEDEKDTDKDDLLLGEEDENDLLDDDDDDAEEEAVLATLVGDDKDNEKIKDKVADNEASKPEDDDTAYDLGLAELLSRKRYIRSRRQSKVMRLK